VKKDINRDYQSEDINELFRQAFRGSKEAEKKLFLNLSVRFSVITRLRISNGNDIEDVIQDTLAVISQKYKGLTDDVNFVAWAHQVLKFQVLKYYKKTGSDSRKSKRLADENQSASGWEPDLMLRDNLLKCLQKINRKSSLYARILNLHYQGFTTGEICEKLKIKANYCYVILLRARSMIEHCLERGEV
jgi:RNA polymerase sigma factor (sigma-70 family)